MKKEYEALSLDVVKFEAQDVIIASSPNGPINQNPTIPNETSVVPLPPTEGPQM